MSSGSNTVPTPSNIAAKFFDFKFERIKQSITNSLFASSTTISPILNLKQQWLNYKNYVQRNEKWMRFLEQAMNNISWVIPGSITGGSKYNVQQTSTNNGDGSISELIFGLSHVLQALNDRALDTETELTVFVGNNESVFVQNLKTFIRIIQHLQVFIELLAISKLTAKARWKCVLVIEFLKMIARLYLLFYCRGHMLIVQTEDEKKHNLCIQECKNQPFSEMQQMYINHGRGSAQETAGIFGPNNIGNYPSLKHSQLAQHMIDKKVESRLIFAEILHIIRPVIYVALHLNIGMHDEIGMSSVGANKHVWTPFLISLLMDIYSQMMYYSSNSLTNRQRSELHRRRKYWLLYLLRPPFFNKFIGNPMVNVCKNLHGQQSKVRYWILC